MCWPKVADGRPKKMRCGANGWLVCCAGCAPCEGICRSAIQLLMRIGAAKKEAGRAFGFVKLQLPEKNEAGHARNTFTFHTDKAKLKAAEQRDGHYLLRSNLTGEDPAVLWTR